jgi:hypothetical protein
VPDKSGEPELSPAQISELAERYNFRDPERPPAPVATDGWFWRLLDKAGRWTAFVAVGLIAVAVLVAWLGGESYGWVTYLYLPATLLLVLYFAYLIRSQQIEKAARYLRRQQEQEIARQQVVRTVLEESRRDSDFRTGDSNTDKHK